MKKIISILLVVMVVNFASIVQAEVRKSTRRSQLVQHYLDKNPAHVSAEATFLQAVSRGDTAFINRVTDSSLFFVEDKFGNNCFHLAKDASTLQALARNIRRLVPAKDQKSSIARLLNGRNHVQETPLMEHINAGKAGSTFFLLYNGSDLALAIEEANKIDKGGALATAAQIKKGIAVGLSKDSGGRTIAQAALDNADKPRMDLVIAFLKRQAPYLF